MKWLQVLDAIKEELRADTILAATFPTIRYAGPIDFVVPCLELMLVGDTETEIWNPMTVQIDAWARSVEEVAAAGARLSILFDQNAFKSYGLHSPIRMFASYLDGATLTGPDRSQVVGRAVRYLLTPLRSPYDQGAIPS